MISILIPVYNFPVFSLVAELSQQLENSKVPSEIIVMDDGSVQEILELNAPISKLPFTRFIQLSQNIGRQAVRAKLAYSARFENLIFLDGDSLVSDKNFIRNYISSIGKSDVVVGGRIYSTEPPSSCALRLHWTYGSQREISHPEWQNNHPYHRFMTNNFMIRSELFRSIEFPEDLKGYGHEDTWLGLHLKRRNASITYINNPVLHEQIEGTENFIVKSKSALDNILRMSKWAEEGEMVEFIRIYRMMRKLQKLNLTGIVRLYSRMFRKRIQKNLHSCRPSLFIFDLFRLNYLIEQYRKNDQDNGTIR